MKYLDSVAFMSDRLPLNNTLLLKELLHDILSRFLRLAKQSSPSRKPQNISLVRKKNTEYEIINQEGTRMVKDGED